MCKSHLLQASPHDKDLLDSVLLDVPAGTTIFGNKGFIDLDQHMKLLDDLGMLLKTPLNYNMQDRLTFQLHPVGNRLRRIIETVNGQLDRPLSCPSPSCQKRLDAGVKMVSEDFTHTFCVCLRTSNMEIPPTQLETLVCA